MTDTNEHAIVLGGSVGGLLAARVLSSHVREVTLIERDDLAEPFAPRKGVPQASHAHGLLAAGFQTVERYFPGIRERLESLGGLSGDIGRDVWVIGGHRLRLESTGVEGICCSRTSLEGALRERVRALPNVRFLTGCDVLGLLQAQGRISGVRLLRRHDGGCEESMPGGLVIDATGRGSRLPRWQEELGYAAPEEERVHVGIRYTTSLFRRDAASFGGARAVVVAARPPNRRCGVALAIDRDHWIVTVVGYLGDHAEPTHAGMRDFARGFPSGELAQLLQNAAPVGAIESMKFPHSQRRYYDRLPAPPEGLLAFGDAQCSFNPIFGQGMTVATLQASALDQCLKSGRTDLPRRFYRASARVIEVPWSIAVGNDLRFPEVEGKRTTGGALLHGYLDRLLAAAEEDPAVGGAFLRVTHLLAPPPSLMKPAVLGRVVRSRLRGGWDPRVSAQKPPGELSGT